MHWITLSNIDDCSETGKINFEAFAEIAVNFLEVEDDEAMAAELKEAFRLYDKEGQFIFFLFFFIFLYFFLFKKFFFFMFFYFFLIFKN